MSAISSHRRFALLMRCVLRTFAPAVALVAVLAAGAAAQEYIVPNGPGPALGLKLSGGVRAEDSPAAFRDAAKTWGMYRIAVIQAAAGHPQDAKHTLWQIDQGPPCCPADVTGVWFCCGMPIYDLPPMPLILYGAALPAAGGTPAPQPPAGRMPALQAARVSGSESPPATAVAGRSGDVAPAARRFQTAGFTVVNRRRSPDHIPAAVPPGLPADYLAADPRHGAVIDFTDERDSGGTRITSRKYADGYVVIETPRAEGLARNAATRPPQ